MKEAVAILDWTPAPRPSVADACLSRPDWTRIARPADGALRLDKNENTDPALRALVASLLENVHPSAATDYPELAPTYHALSAYLGVDPRTILITAGSDGAIRTAFETFISPGDVVVHTEPTFAMYPVYSRMFGAKVASIAYQRGTDGPVLTAAAFCDHIAAVRPRMVCLPNPDSPTGTVFDAAEVERIVSVARSAGAVMLIDEAYHPFHAGTALPLVDRYENLIVTRTFAKAWGLAGLRIGYLVASPALAALLHKVRPMYEVNGIAVAVVNALLGRAGEMERSVALINDGKREFAKRMRAAGFAVFEGSGNFIHVDFGAARDAVIGALRNRVLYRESFSEPCLAGYSRFTTAPRVVMDELAGMIEAAISK